MSIPGKIQIRNDTAANWSSVNPVLSQAEPGFVRDGAVFKIGDGVTPFNALPGFKNSVQVDAAVAAAQAAAAEAAADALEVAAAIANLNPTVLAVPGALVMFPATTAPAGYLKANGATGLLRADFPALWAFIQGSGLLAASEGAKQPWQFGPGNGTTTFSLIDARGYALRAWDDGRGVDAGRGLGTYQADLIKDHGHGASSETAGVHNHGITDLGHSHSINDLGHSHGFTETGGNGGFGGGEGYDAGGFQMRSFNRTTNASGTGISIVPNGTGITVNNGGGHTHTINVGSVSGGLGGAETRMKNVAYLLCIKY